MYGRLMIDGVDASAIKQEVDHCSDLAKRIARNNEVFRKAISDLYRAMQKHKIPLTDRQISKCISEESGCDRSLLSRLLWCVKMEILTHTPQGVIKESALRELRRICESENWETSIDDAYDSAGNYENITANLMFECVNRNGYLKEGVRKSGDRELQPSTKNADRRLTRDVTKREKPTMRLANKHPDDPKFEKTVAKTGSRVLDRKWLETRLHQKLITPLLKMLLDDRVLGLNIRQRQELRRILS
jgi:hypothetical protein